jgi:hypothetical protein
MTLAKLIKLSAASALLFGGACATANAQDAAVLSMKPAHGISFDVGSKRAVSYFLSDAGQCRLVLTLAARPDFGEIPSLTATRVEARVRAGRSARFTDHDLSRLEFSCQRDAQSMTVNRIEKVAAHQN